jgi:hypothetical protein
MQGEGGKAKSKNGNNTPRTGYDGRKIICH